MLPIIGGKKIKLRENSSQMKTQVCCPLMGEKIKIKRNTITSERPRYVAHYGRKIKLREKPSHK